ncbi:MULTISPECIES: 3'-5' exonuclease [unclassified Neisseria]|uniref:3'-5' exonuclease n=1 Tax=unclassified Neisseria TaxID=2623750 RepID=UPI0010727DB5|nr:MULTISPECIES: 3'-5' exonuclease [unclassified Neisseria]MBF0803972.1 3'-5' exonuclease [Neisseria sp. 19428wB4_WF04]TFU43311.1 3'-5' exonuclease [Neisseria sp. WF04]
MSLSHITAPVKNMNHSQPYLTRYGKLGHIIWESRETLCQCTKPKCSHSIRYIETFYASPTCPKCKSRIEHPYKYIVFDVESPAVKFDKAKPNSEENPTEFRICQFSWAVYRHDGNLEYIQNHIIQPNGYRLPADHQNRRGFSHDDACKQGRPILEVISLFQQDLARYPADEICLIAFNISHDIGLINKELLRTGQDEINFSTFKQFCLMKNTTSLCELTFPDGREGFKHPSLMELHQYLFGGFSNWHNAFYDVQATARCFFELVGRKYIVCTHEIDTIADLRNETKHKQEYTEKMLSENKQLENRLEHTKSALSSALHNNQQLQEHRLCLDRDIRTWQSRYATLTSQNKQLRFALAAITTAFFITIICYFLWPSENHLYHAGNQPNQLVIAKNTALYKRASRKSGNFAGFIQKCSLVSVTKNNNGISEYGNGKWLHISYTGKICQNQNMKGKCLNKHTAGWVDAKDIQSKTKSCPN